MKHRDEEIISLMRQQKTSNRGFRMLMDAYQERLYWHIRRMVVENESAQDILQETFIKVYRNFHQFKQDSPRRLFVRLS